MDPELLKKLNKRKQEANLDTTTNNTNNYVLQSPGASGGYLTAPSQQLSINSNNNTTNESSNSSEENEILLDDIAFPTPPLGKPSQEVNTTNVDIDLPLGRPPHDDDMGEEDDEDDGSSIGDEFRKLVEKLVRQGKIFFGLCSLFCAMLYIL